MPTRNPIFPTPPAVAILALGVCSCGTSSSANADGAPSDSYPAFNVDMPQLQNNGGFFDVRPVFVAVTFPSETPDKVAVFEELNDKIGTSDYWKQITSEYGVGPASNGGHVHSPANLSTTDATDPGIDAYVADHATNFAKYGWPAPTDQTIYVLYVPGSTRFIFHGQDVCATGATGYHASTNVGAMDIAYAVVFECESIDVTTLSASHEMAEATLDTHPSGTPGWYGVDDRHLAWQFLTAFQSENADLCELYPDAPYAPMSDTITAVVQRQWSNKSAAAGHNPCVPVPDGAYFNVVPLDLEDIEIDLSAYGGPPRVMTRGYHVAQGETKSFSVGFHSDGPAEAWSITAVEGNGGSVPTKPRLSISVDKTSGRNGEKAAVTVSVDSVNPNTQSGLMTIESTNGAVRHLMPILIGSK